MIIALSAAIIGAVSLGIVVRLKEHHVNMDDLFNELEVPRNASTDTWSAVPAQMASANSTPADVLFTESLLCLNRVGLRVPGDSPVHETAESSSLVSVRPAQSKNHVSVS